MGAAPLPAGAVQHRRHGILEALVGVADNQLDPPRPRATSERRNAVQAAPSSAAPTSNPRISRCPSALTPVATSAAVLTTRPCSRTLTTSASSHPNAYGPASNGRFRHPATTSSSSAHTRLTCDLEMPSKPSRGQHHPPGGSTRPPHSTARPPRSAPAPPVGAAPASTARSCRGAPWGSPARSCPPWSPNPRPVAVAMRHTIQGALAMLSTNLLADLGFHQRLGKHPDPSRTKSTSPASALLTSSTSSILDTATAWLLSRC